FLETVVDPQTTERQKVSALRRLKAEIGAQAFQRGEDPPPYNPKREKEFKAWLKKKSEEDSEKVKGFKELIKRDEELQKKLAEKRKRRRPARAAPSRALAVFIPVAAPPSAGHNGCVSQPTEARRHAQRPHPPRRPAHHRPRPLARAPHHGSP